MDNRGDRSSRANDPVDAKLLTRHPERTRSRREELRGPRRRFLEPLYMRIRRELTLQRHPCDAPLELAAPGGSSASALRADVGFQRFMKCRNPHNPQQRQARELLHSTISGHSPQLCTVLLISQRNYLQKGGYHRGGILQSTSASREPLQPAPPVPSCRRPVENGVRGRYNGRPFRHDEPARNHIVRDPRDTAAREWRWRRWTDRTPRMHPATNTRAVTADDAASADELVVRIAVYDERGPATPARDREGGFGRLSHRDRR